MKESQKVVLGCSGFRYFYLWNISEIRSMFCEESHHPHLSKPKSVHLSTWFIVSCIGPWIDLDSVSVSVVKPFSFDNPELKNSQLFSGVLLALLQTILARGCSNWNHWRVPYLITEQLNVSSSYSLLILVFFHRMAS